MTAAIICEYNPFHNGHKYLVDEIRRILGEETRIIAVMSGNFVQRGEPAAIDKWARAKAALMCGVDAVVEIPSVFAASSAQYFAEAAVSIVNNLGFIDYLVFGSETGDTEMLLTVGRERAFPSAEFQASLKEGLKEGLSYPAAMQKAFSGTELLSNDILAVEYVRALLLSGSRVKPLAVKRCGNNSHNDGTLSGAAVSSAKSLRMILQSDIDINELASYMPEEALSAQFIASFAEQKKITVIDDFEQLIFSQIRMLGREGLSKLPFVTEGLENKIYTECCRSNSIAELIDNCTGTRYTRTRITRILISLITGARASLFSADITKVPYVRVLGVRRTSKALLSEIANACVSGGCDFIAGNFPAGLDGVTERTRAFLRREATATDLYFLAQTEKKADCEYNKPLIIV